METTETMPKESRENRDPSSGGNKSKRDKLFLYLFLLMLIASGILGWLYWGQKKETQDVITTNIQVTQESEVVKKDLQQLQTEYDALKTNDTALKSEIDAKKDSIEQLLKQVKAGNYDIHKLKKETKTLRDIMQHFVVEIDSLNTMNKHLIASKDSVTTELYSEKKKSSTLQTEKDKLYKMGSVIKASGMTVAAINVHGRNKEDETKKARKTDKIKIAFTLGENKIAPKGKRDVYVRMVTPDGKEWTESADADHMFTFNNSKGFYAAKKSIDYENDDMNVTIFVKKKDKEDLLPGKYLVEINLDNTTIGSASLELE